MSLLTMNILGAGRLGKTIGYLLAQQAGIKIQGIHNKTSQSTQDAIRFIGDGQDFSDVKTLPSARITMVSTSDDVIESICAELCRGGKIQPGDVFFHCSGVLTSEALSPVKQWGAAVASFHPMKSFSDPRQAIKTYADTYCGVEGDEEALACLAPLFQKIGSKIYSIKKEKKALYHAAGVFASNYLIALVQPAMQCLEEAGLASETALKMVASLMRGTLNNVQTSRSSSSVLTGPIKRGDIETIKKHVGALPTHQQKRLYAILGEIILDLTVHPEVLKTAIKDILSV